MKKFLFLALVTCLPLLISCNLNKDRAASFSGKSNTDGTTFADGRYEIDPLNSTIYWKTSLLGGGHVGGVTLKYGELDVQDGQPQSGSFAVDMDSLTNADVEDPALRQQLISELKSDDFLAVSSYPMARFDITQIRADENGTVDYPYRVDGDLSFKNNTGPATVSARISKTQKGLTIAGHAEQNSLALDFNLLADRL